MASARPPSTDGYDRPPRPPSSLSMMSTASSFTSQALDRLSEMNKCPKCNEQIRDPRMLPCHHTFCADCIREMIGSATRNEFLCPLDRTTIAVPPLGMDAFPPDNRMKELENIRIDLEQSLVLEDPETADLDINLESLNKGVKDIEHSSAMAQHEVNTMFEAIQKSLKKKQDSFIQDIRRKSRRQISLLEFEKFRLIETKKFQNEQLMGDSSFYEEEIIEPFNRGQSINTSTPPSPVSFRSRNHHYNSSTSSEPRLALLACHIGQQHIEFNETEGGLTRLEEQVEKLGKVTCDFDLKVKLDRNLLTLDEFPFGMKVGGNDSFEWQPSQPKGLCRRSPTSILMVSSGKSEVIEMDNSFNVVCRISGRNVFSNNISDVASSNGYIYVADAGACQVVMLSKDGTLVKRFGKAGTGAQEFKRPNGLCVDSKGRVIVSDSLNHRVKILSPDLKTVILTITNDRKKYKEAGRFSFPYGVACDKEDNIYIVDTNNKRLVQISKDGKFLKEIYPADMADPRCVAVTSDHRILVTDRENAQLLIIDLHTNTTTRVSGITDSHGREITFKQPYGVVVDGTDKVYVSDIERNALFVL
ncbi:uncharacterized protein [Clytia hemisphaerica]|uniref:RING-type domain-containing protein n=1 Tax=Clytia hemisphaerica TaxID=252671 RepID=A0A7M5UR83_9CNID